MGESMMENKPLRMGDTIESLIEQHGRKKMEGPSPGPDSARIDGTVYQSETFLSVPIQLRGHLLGMINVSDKKEKNGNGFTDLDLKILFMIVRQVRIAIENAKLYRELKSLTLIDPLTGIYNYRFFTQSLDYEIVRAKRYKRHLTFLMIDIDQFKSYNDTFGRRQGDWLLKSVAKTIKHNIRETDMVCRYAGDEFAVILPETDLAQARMTATKITKNVSTLPARRIVTVSIGIAQWDLNTNRYELIRRADSHLYKAKQQGKNQVSG